MYRIWIGAHYVDKWQLSKVRKYVKSLTVDYIVKKYTGTKSGEYAPKIAKVFKKHNAWWAEGHIHAHS